MIFINVGGVGMAVLMTKDKNEMIVTCDCGCMASYHMKIYKEGTSPEIYGYMSFLKSNFEDEQYGPWNAFKRKVEKIWNILRGKD